MVKKRLPYYFDEYKRGRSILQLARDATFSPYLFARYIVEDATILRGGKKVLSEAMRDPEGILGRDSVLVPDYHAAEQQGALCAAQK